MTDEQREQLADERHKAELDACVARLVMELGKEDWACYNHVVRWWHDWGFGVAIFVLQSDDFKLGRNGFLMSIFGDYMLVLDKTDGTPARHMLNELTYLKQLSSIDHKPTTPSLTATAQSIGATAVSAGFFLGGSVAGAIVSALIGHNIAQKTEEKHKNTITKTTYQLQVGFSDNTTAILEVDKKEYKHFAKQLSRFALI